jgi:hypothetical protein
MVKVIATTRGFYGEVRDPGNVFDIDDDLWADKAKRPKWAERFKGSIADAETPSVSGIVGVEVPDDWQSLSVDDKKELAEKIATAVGNDGARIKTAADAENIISLYSAIASMNQTFGEAPPVKVVEGNGLQAGLGGSAPDWLPPSGNGKPVMAND